MKFRIRKSVIKKSIFIIINDWKLSIKSYFLYKLIRIIKQKNKNTISLTIFNCFIPIIFEFLQKSFVNQVKCTNERITTYLAQVLLAILQEYKITTTSTPTQHSRKGHSKTTKNTHRRWIKFHALLLQKAEIHLQLTRKLFLKTIITKIESSKTCNLQYSIPLLHYPTNK